MYGNYIAPQLLFKRPHRLSSLRPHKTIHFHSWNSVMAFTKIIFLSWQLSGYITLALEVNAVFCLHNVGKINLLSKNKELSLGNTFIEATTDVFPKILLKLPLFKN